MPYAGYCIYVYYLNSERKIKKIGKVKKTASHAGNMGSSPLVVTICNIKHLSSFSVGAFLVIPHTIPHTKQQKQPPCKNPTKQYLVIIIDPVDLGRTVSSNQLSFCRAGLCRPDSSDKGRRYR